MSTPKEIADGYHQILDGLEMPEHVRREGRQNVIDELTAMIESCGSGIVEDTEMTERVYWSEVLKEFKNK